MPVKMLYKLKASISCVVQKTKKKFVKSVSKIWSEREHLSGLSVAFPIKLNPNLGTSI